MSDEDFYLQATNEVDGSNIDPALWAKAMALSEGDKEKAKYQYIKFRVEQLSNIKPAIKPDLTKKTVDEFYFKYIPVTEFSKIKSIPEKKIIEMIKDGFYSGQIKDKQWYVSKDEINKGDIKKEIVTPPLEKIKSTEQEYTPVEEFAEYKGFTSEKVIAMIKDGFYQGQIIDDKWYVSYSEISNDKLKLQNSCNLEWKTIWKWIAILYSISLIGFTIKASVQMGGLEFQNAWQFIAFASLPAIHMFWFAVIAIIYLLTKQFKIEQAAGFLSILGWVYVIFIVFRLISSQQL